LTEPATATAHIVLIDSKTRLQAVARLANFYGLKEATTVIRDLAVAVGAQCRGGRIYIPGRDMYQAHGWAMFIDLVRFGAYDFSWFVDRMTRHAIATQASVTIPAELAERIRSYRKKEMT
jgi:hypothetical protein